MIRTLFSLMILLSVVHGTVLSQKCYPFWDPPESEPSVQELEEKYSGSDSTSEGEFLKPSIPRMSGIDTAYRGFVQDLGPYLQDRGFEWKSKTRYFQRIYFEPNGRASYYLYEFRNDEQAPTGERRELFERLVEEFLSSHKLGVEAEGRFAVCAPVILKPKE